MVQIISQYKLGDTLMINAKINGRHVSVSLRELQNKAIEFKQAVAQFEARRLLSLNFP